MWDSSFWNKYFCWDCWSCIHLEKSWSIWNSSIGNIFLFSSVCLKVISIFLMLFFSMDLSIMDEGSLPNWTIWVHAWSSWVVVSTLNVWNTSFRYKWSRWDCWCCIHLEESWSVWDSSVSYFFLFGTVCLKIISIFLMLFFSVYFTIVDSSSLPNISIWIHFRSTWVIISTS